MPHLENLRREIADSGFTLRGPDRSGKKPKKGKKPPKGRKQLKVTVSIGTAATSGHKGSAEDLIKMADECLYKAKQGGRNKVVVAT